MKHKDILRFDVTVTIRHYAHYVAPRFMRGSTSSQTSIPITCERFLENNHGFLLSVICSLPGYVPESLIQLERRIVFEVQRDLEVESNSCTDSKCREFSLALDIFIDVVQYEERDDEEDAMIEIEESMQQGVVMVPASDEAIQSLKAFTDSSFLKIEKCNICMDKFEVDEGDDQDDVLSMPCNHVFHRECIVKWLQTSHTCPLCRYPMPTAYD
uniref:RING-type E3 ubiquitin transferase n=2 Tax=Cajanus cajan TaxID=3821 RepID=A0A151UBF7_CAJCA|nr:E3 ubiquitin-protein ligase RNF181 [Cajanus cajan]